MINDKTPRPPGILSRGLGRWHETPLYMRIIGAVVLGVIVGLMLGTNAGPLEIPSKLVLRLLGALAPPLILLAIIKALVEAKIEGRHARKLISLLLINTLVAIGIGLLVANVLKPGRWATLQPAAKTAAHSGPVDPLSLFLENIPKSVMGPLSDDGKVIGVVFLALAFGIAVRRVLHEPIRNIKDVIDLGMKCCIIVLHWLIDVIPLAVFGIIASIVGTKGFGEFKALGAFVLAVLTGLALQTVYYLVRVKFGSWVRPRDLVRGMRDALVMAFSTASSTATMPVTYACLTEKVGIRPQSASLGALVGANFNNDGTALYEAMSALFVSQMLGLDLTLGQQMMVVLTSVIASVGAAGIPEAGLVTMTLVFKAVALPTDYIAVLLTIDWFLDRCRTTVNVMGDTNVSCLLDGKTPPTAEEAAGTAETVVLVPNAGIDGVQ